MKKYIIYTLIVTIAVFLGSCNKDDIDTKRSIFDPTEVYEPNEFGINIIFRSEEHTSELQSH